MSVVNFKDLQFVYKSFKSFHALNFASSKFEKSVEIKKMNKVHLVNKFFTQSDIIMVDN